MRNRMAYYCKAIGHGLLLLSFNLAAASTSVNVYLKLQEPNKVSSLIGLFNESVAEHQLFEHYQFEPFLKTHPLHITLYLAQYPSEKIPKLIAILNRDMHTHKNLTLNTGSLVTSNSGYTLLSVDNTPELQQLSNHIVKVLNPLRDQRALIPQWAKQDSKRQELFRCYGSPGVFDLYRPHLSVFDPLHLNQKQQQRLMLALQELIAQFSQQHKTQQSFQTYALGIGVANAQGQIIRELAEIKFSKQTFVNHLS